MSVGSHAIVVVSRHDDAPLAASVFNEVNDVLWDFLDGFTVLAWLRSCKTARSGDWWMSRAQRAKKMFQEVQAYLDSGKAVLPGFDLNRDRVKARLLPLNPARAPEVDGGPGGHNWELHRRFYEENPRLSHCNYKWLVNTTVAKQNPRWHQLKPRDVQGAGEELLAGHEEVLRIVDLDSALYAPWDILTCPHGYIQGFGPPALVFLGLAYGNFFCALQATLEN